MVDCLTRQSAMLGPLISDPLRCRRCGGTLQLIAFIVEPAAIMRILDHLGFGWP